MGDLEGCLVRTDLRPSLAGLVDESRAFSLLAERVGVVTVVVGGNDDRAIAVDVDLVGGGLRPNEVGVVVAAELMRVRRQGNPTGLAPICRPKNRPALANCDTGQTIASKMNVKKIDEGSAGLREPGDS